MAYITTVQRPTSISLALRVSLFPGDEDCLVITKTNRLEIFKQIDGGLAPIAYHDLNGFIIVLEKVRPEDSMADHIFIGVDSMAFFTLTWDINKRRFQEVRSFENLSNPHSRFSRMGNKWASCPGNGTIAVMAHEGTITLFPQQNHKCAQEEYFASPVIHRIPQYLVRSTAFLFENGKCEIILLFENPLKRISLMSYEVDERGGLGDYHYISANIDQNSQFLIAVPQPTGGFLILSEISITLILTPDTIFTHPLDEANVWLSWVWLDNRLLLADDFGRLFLVSMFKSQDGTVIFQVAAAGTTSRASVLVSLGQNRVFVGSHSGESQLLSFDIPAARFDIVDAFPNTAPIIDFTILDIDMEASGQVGTNKRIIDKFSSGKTLIATGSGAFSDGSIGCVRSSVQLEELGSLCKGEDVVYLFGLRSMEIGENKPLLVDVLIASCAANTRVFVFESDGIEEKAVYKGLVTNEHTLVARKLPGDRVLQVTDARAILIDWKTGDIISEWWPEGPYSCITAAGAHQDCLVVCTRGQKLTVLSLESMLAVITERYFGVEDRISFVSLSCIFPEICVVGFWSPVRFCILNLDHLGLIHSEVLEQCLENEETSRFGLIAPREAVIAQILPNAPPTLVVSLADGDLLTFSLSQEDHTLSGRKSFLFGHVGAHLSVLPAEDGLDCVLVNCVNPSLIYSNKGTITYSAISADGAVCACPFNAESFPGAIAIGSPELIRLAQINFGKITTHLRSRKIGETIRALAYSNKKRVLGVATIKATLENGFEELQSFFRIYIESTFSLSDTFKFRENEIAQSVIYGKLTHVKKEGLQKLDRFIIGTEILDNSDSRVSSGRIIIFEVTPARKLRLVSELNLVGGCRVVGIVAGKVIAAYNRKVGFQRSTLRKGIDSLTLLRQVCVFNLKCSPFKPPVLKAESPVYLPSMAVDMSITGNFIALSVLSLSAHILEYVPSDSEEDRGELVLKARHHKTIRPTAISQVATGVYLEGSAGQHLVLLASTEVPEEVDGVAKLEIASMIAIHETVNRIRPFRVSTPCSAIVDPRAFIATVQGSILLFALINNSKVNFLMKLQSNMAECMPNLGGLSFNTYRSNDMGEVNEPFRFVDGNLIERFLDFGEEAQQLMVEGLDHSLEEVRTMVEELRSLH
ncbi:MAG: hypothetical protein M1829_004890 [Trizodia sp. TS-e1964]|nr:MAG: hypothetical protein M1829_004890 [Trizodia sp. TS-e1964]